MPSLTVTPPGVQGWCCRRVLTEWYRILVAVLIGHGELDSIKLELRARGSSELVSHGAHTASPGRGTVPGLPRAVPLGGRPRGSSARARRRPAGRRPATRLPGESPLSPLAVALA